MTKKTLLLIIIISLLLPFCENNLSAAEPKDTSGNNSQNSSIDRNNQMMLAFVQRMKSGNVTEARKIAKEMTAFANKYTDTADVEYKNFYSNMEKELYLLKNKNSKKKVVWVDDPIADGYYFLAVIDFQAKHYKEAKENIQKCIFWNPVRAPYYCERGFIFLNSGVESDYISAQVAYEQALEYADNEEDFASALRGVGFAFASRNMFEESVAAMVLSKEFEPNNTDAEEHILRMKNFIPSFDFSMDSKKARKILKDNKIQTTYSPEHVKVLIKLASELKMPEEKEKALIFLTRAQMLEPVNVEVINKLKEIQKKIE